MPLLLLNARLKALNHCRGILTRRSDAGECYMKRGSHNDIPQSQEDGKGGRGVVDGNYHMQIPIDNRNIKYFDELSGDVSPIGLHVFQIMLAS